MHSLFFLLANAGMHLKEPCARGRIRFRSITAAKLNSSITLLSATPLPVPKFTHKMNNTDGGYV